MAQTERLEADTSWQRARVAMYIESPPETIWYYLATPAGMNAYLTDVATIDSDREELAEGDTIRIVIGDLVNEARCVACVKPFLLSLEDHFRPLLPNGSVCEYRIRTHFRLKACKEMSKVTVEVEGYTQDDFMQWIRESGEMGWRQSLFNLKNVIELGLDLRNEIFGYPRLGVSNCTATAAKIRQIGLDPSRVSGNYLLEVYPNSPAEQAGLQAGDVVTEIAGRKTATYRQFVQALGAAANTAREVEIVYYREGERHRTTAHLSYAEEYTGLFDPTDQPLEEVAKQRRKRME
ncbi:MAG: PDZ domain-containing protein [Brevibacillus sp.]|nr:PDZ domain-containing protein [Brevibacillus sp.]